MINKEERATVTAPVGKLREMAVTVPVFCNVPEKQVLGEVTVTFASVAV